MLHRTGCSCDMLGANTVLYTLLYNGKLHKSSSKCTKEFQLSSVMAVSIKENFIVKQSEWKSPIESCFLVIVKLYVNLVYLTPKDILAHLVDTGGYWSSPCTEKQQ